ncbi:MAG: protein-tyrosine phosphatase family protein [Verrucomicrobiota bacterium JB025]|nr:serine/threonine protein phosphatase [Verrucomicrobiota bacterium JB025]
MLPQHYPVEPGILLAGEYPGDRNPAIAKARIHALVKLGVHTFIDLTTAHDCLTPYENSLAELTSETGIPLRRIAAPIPDMSVPATEEIMRSIMAGVRQSIASDPAVYIHCWGGIGRTGTVVGCWLRERGFGPDDALEKVQHLYSTHMPKVRRHPESPQTRQQKDYIRAWQGIS